MSATGSQTGTYPVHTISEGAARGELLFSDDPICFYLAEPATGRIVEPGHALEGRSVAGKILVFPNGKGSSVVQADGLFHLLKQGNAPAALVTRHADTTLVASAIILGIPMVDGAPEEFYSACADGDLVSLDADEGIVEVER